jgi:nucleoside-diphosphate-sugar epimerase
LEACRKHGKKLIHASTSEALGGAQYIDGMDEEHPYSPDNPYGATKASADMLVTGWVNSYDLDATILRSFNMTGVGQSGDLEGAFIPRVINKVINNQSPVIYGSGEQRRDYIWVGDVAKAYLILAKGNYRGQVFHVGSGTNTNIKSIAQTVIDISKKPLSIKYVKSRPKELRSLRCDYSKIAKLGWQPTKQLSEILKEMYEAELLRGMSE